MMSLVQGRAPLTKKPLMLNPGKNRIPTKNPVSSYNYPEVDRMCGIYRKCWGSFIFYLLQ